MVLVFDLDDTLYPEITFVKSGFREVSAWLGKKFGIDKTRIYNNLLEVLNKQGRGNIFDTVLQNYGIFSKQLVMQCLQIYRLHIPDIKLTPEAKACLKSFKNLPLYIVTDGHKIVQSNKVSALKLEKYVKHIYITYRHGIKNSKPSPYCFQLIAKKENTTFDQVTYVGDNPVKDFIGIKPLGCKTIRVLQGNYKDLRMDQLHEADVMINSLKELTQELIQERLSKII